VRRALLPGALVAAAAGAAALLGHGDDPYRLHAEFRDASGLRAGSQVKIGGVVVGEVSHVTITPRDTADAVLAVDRRRVRAIGTGARADIRPLNLLGEKFVDLRVGDLAHPEPGRPRIPLARTAAPTELDDVLSALEPTTRVRLAVLIREGGVALAGRGDDLAASLRLLPHTSEDLRAITDQAGRDTGALRRLLDQSDRVVAAVAAQRRGVARFVENGAAALEAPASRPGALGGTLRAAPGTLGRLRTTLRRLDTTGAALRPAARGLSATAPGLTTTLHALPAFTSAARPALSALSQAAPDLAKLGRQGAPTIRRLRSVADALNALTGDTDKVTRTLDLGAGDLLGLMEGWARTIQPRDAVGHVFRIDPTLTPYARQAIEAYVRDGTIPGARRRRAHRRGGAVSAPAPAHAPAQGAAPPPTSVPPTVRKAVQDVLHAGGQAPGGALPGGTGQPAADAVLNLLLGP
jgi:phospholipid/cholesterol/gamma-HCH transport system substrate-binding protein